VARLQTARLENLVRRWGSIKSAGSVLSETLGDVFPVLDLENLTPENQLTAGWFLFQGQASVTGAVAGLAAVQVLNPAGSDVIVVIDKCKVNTTATRAIGFGTAVAPLTAAINTTTRDTRAGQVFTGKALIRTSTDATGALGDLTIVPVANVDYDLDLPHGIAVLGPGGALTFVDSVVNSVLRVLFFGRARIAEPSELSF